ncbi:hypothetical protein [Pseudonocardia adelaidensis]|uniref:Uncharacterized protein n=1 Tax=Pseudonocardia adelaidensis TaxID=648754 RepID=A0ABP9NII2_9PSEU
MEDAWVEKVEPEGGRWRWTRMKPVRSGDLTAEWSVTHQGLADTEEKAWAAVRLERAGRRVFISKGRDTGFKLVPEGVHPFDVVDACGATEFGFDPEAFGLPPDYLSRPHRWPPG